MKFIPRKLVILLSILTFSLNLHAQDETMDALNLALKHAKHDTTRIKILSELSEICEIEDILKYAEPCVKLCEKGANSTPSGISKSFYLKHLAGALNNIGFLSKKQSDLPKALKYYQKSLKIQEDIKDKWGIATTLNNIGGVYNNQGNIPKALEYFHKSLKIQEETGDKNGISMALNNIGFIYQNQGDIPNALEYYHRSLKIDEEIKNKRGISTSLNNIGLIYDKQGEIPKALEYYQRGLKIQEEMKDKEGIAITLNNMGVIYENQGNITKASEYYHRSLKIKEEIKDKNGIANSLNNIGHIYSIQGNSAKALDYFRKSLSIREEIKDKKGIAYSLDNLASAMLKKGMIAEALNFASRSLNIAKEIGNPEIMNKAAGTLKDIYMKQKQYKKAFEMYELEIQMRDSINNSETRKASVKKQFQYQYEKKAAADSVLNSEERKVKNAKLSVQNAQLKQEKTQRFALYCGLLLVIVFSAIVFNRFKISQKQKQIIEKQKDEVEEQKKEIIDSITYAKRLQKAILPRRSEIRENLPLSFVFYKPKDIVAGDFYWAEKVNGYYFIAAADCTGHGVPGAMVSVVCSNALNRTVNEFGITETGKILDQVRDLVLDTFKKSGDEIKDGMDISLCRINKTTREIQWSGANNPLWYFDKNELQEIKADKQPIGKYDFAQAFTTHDLVLDKGTNLYLFTDGYADQFGTDDKKMTKKRFRELIVSTQNSPMPEQKQVIEDFFENWKGNTEQLDDVCVIGISI